MKTRILGRGAPLTHPLEVGDDEGVIHQNLEKKEMKFLGCKLCLWISLRTIEASTGHR